MSGTCAGEQTSKDRAAIIADAGDHARACPNPHAPREKFEAGDTLRKTNSGITTMTSTSNAALVPNRQSRVHRGIATHLVALVLVAAFVGGCSTLPPGADYPKTVSAALAQPETT